MFMILDYRGAAICITVEDALHAICLTEDDLSARELAKAILERNREVLNGVFRKVLVQARNERIANTKRFNVLQ